MKRKFADRRGWKRIVDKTYKLIPISDEAFKGYLAVYKILKVTEPLFVDVCGRENCAVDEGYTWLQLFDGTSPYVMTAIFDREGTVVEWYFDICKQQALDKDGVPYLDDLYLDVVVAADMQMELIDQKELDEALKDDIINKQEYDFAESTAENLMEEIRACRVKLIDTSKEYFRVYAR